MTETPKIATVFDDESMHVGQVYAKALLAAAQAEGKVDIIVDQLSSLVRDCLDKKPVIETALSDPKMNVEDKVALLDRVFGKQMDGTLLRFLKVAARRRRLDSIRSILQTVSKIRDEAQGRLQVFVTTAQPLEAAQSTSLMAKLKDIFKADVSLSSKVDPSILGGLLIRIGDTVYDGSVDGQLKLLKKTTLARTENAMREKVASLVH